MDGWCKIRGKNDVKEGDKDGFKDAGKDDAYPQHAAGLHS